MTGLSDHHTLRLRLDSTTLADLLNQPTPPAPSEQPEPHRVAAAPAVRMRATNEGTMSLPHSSGLRKHGLPYGGRGGEHIDDLPRSASAAL
ncbi:hypothetical protein ACGFMO_32620 [Streptomyces niveus]|jgi:hypothetical protein|uniref:hypothetical protein n=1 Tax=Streptomyces niveus TaxID=193462 RepID=UPI003713D225